MALLWEDPVSPLTRSTGRFCQIELTPQSTQATLQSNTSSRELQFGDCLLADRFSRTRSRFHAPLGASSGLGHDHSLVNATGTKPGIRHMSSPSAGILHKPSALRIRVNNICTCTWKAQSKYSPCTISRQDPHTGVQAVNSPSTDLHWTVPSPLPSRGSSHHARQTGPAEPTRPHKRRRRPRAGPQATARPPASATPSRP